MKKKFGMGTIAMTFVALQGTLIGLGFLRIFPAHQIAPISIGGGVVFVTIVWIRKVRT